MEKVTFSSLIVALILSVLVSMYAGATLFFKDSFHFKTFINDLDIGGKTVAAAQMAVQTKGEEFVLSLYGKGADKEKQDEATKLVMDTIVMLTKEEN